MINKTSYENEVDLMYISLAIKDNSIFAQTKLTHNHFEDVLVKLIFAIAIRSIQEKSCFLPLVDLKPLFDDKDRLEKFALYNHSIVLSNPENLMESLKKYEPKDYKIQNIEKTIMERYTKEKLNILSYSLHNDLKDSSKSTNEILRRYSYSIDTLMNNNVSTRQTLTSDDVIKSELNFLNSPKEDSFPLTGLPIDIVNEGLNAPSLTVILGHAKSGKAQPLYSKILTPKGYTTFADIEVGDEIMSPSGKIEKVIAIPYEGIQKVYRVTFLDGSYADFGEHHLMNVINPSSKNEKTLEIADIIKRGVRKNNKYQNRVRVVKPLDFNNTEQLPIHPYLLGVLLGDEYLANDDIAIINGEQDIVDRLISIIGTDNCSVSFVDSKNAYQIRIKRSTDFGKNLKNALISLNLIDKKSKDKFIPDIYKFSSIEDRKQLLYGLFDTDGCIEGTSKVFYTTSTFLRDDVSFLTNSLGYIPSIRTKIAKYNGKEYGESYGVNIQTLDEIFLSEKHKSKHKQRTKPILKTIVDIQYLEEMETKCITTSDPEGLYITDNFIVTHNSTFLYNSAISSLRQGRTILFVTIEIPVAECFRKLMSIYTQIPYSNINKKNLTDDQKEEYMKLVTKFSEDYKDRLFIIDDSKGISSKDIKVYVDQLEKAGIKIDDIFVDYILIMNSNNPNLSKVESLSAISTELRELSQATNTRIITAQQLHSKSADKDLTELTFDDVYFCKNISHEATYSIAIDNQKISENESLLRTIFLPSRQCWDTKVRYYPNFKQETLTLNECVEHRDDAMPETYADKILKSLDFD